LHLLVSLKEKIAVYQLNCLFVAGKQLHKITVMNVERREAAEFETSHYYLLTMSLLFIALLLLGLSTVWTLIVKHFMSSLYIFTVLTVLAVFGTVIYALEKDDHLRKKKLIDQR